MAHEKATPDLVCADCGRVLQAADEERTWAKCTFCRKPVCFDSIRYMGTTVKGPFMDYVEAVRTCNKCYVPRG